MSGGQVVIEADEFIRIIETIEGYLRKLRELGRIGFTSKSGPSEAPAGKGEAMTVDINISEIDWMGKGSAQAGPEAGWAWAFAYDKDGDVLPETEELVIALERYGKVRVGPYEISFGGRDGNLLNRKRSKN